jgi:hypothetical protein
VSQVSSLNSTDVPRIRQRGDHYLGQRLVQEALRTVQHEQNRIIIVETAPGRGIGYNDLN